MFPLPAHLLARLRWMPITPHAMTLIELRQFLLETVQTIDRLLEDHQRQEERIDRPI